VSRSRGSTHLRPAAVALTPAPSGLARDWTDLRRTIVILLVAALCGCGNRGAPSPGQERLHVVYISPKGNDKHSGTSRHPMRTLTAVSAKLTREAPDRDVEVRCISDRGIYWNQFAMWDYWSPSHTTTIRSWPASTHARFEMKSEAACASPFFTFDAKAGEATNLRVDGLLVVSYNAGAISIIGSWPNENPALWNGNNRISHCVFADIGNLGRPSVPCTYGVVDFVRSVCDTVEDCTFYRCENDRSGAPPIIAVYLAHHSRGNVIRSNLFRGIGGNTIKLRDRSNANLIENNTFIRCGGRQGQSANVISWYCDRNLMDLECEFSGEGPSDSTVIRNNVARGATFCDTAVLWADLMLNLPAAAHCWPCVGDSSHVALSGNTVEGCREDDYEADDKAPY
jgi:hypothetical protein